MEKMKFNISARTTILIGREGVSRADGAIIELIKNTYDADADFCYIAFDIANDKMYILDNGIGMTKNTVENFWMLIGTDNKRQQFMSERNRVKSGEKGIGRFALDRLGSKCTMYTKHLTEPLIYWFNDWNKFEEQNKTIDEIEADFSYLDSSFSDILPDFIKANIESLKIELKQNSLSNNKVALDFSLDTGTLFIVEGLRDKWDKSEIDKIYSVLGFLVPPGEQTQYYIFAQKSPAEVAEEIECDAIDDFDYRVTATFDGEKVCAKIYRNEFDINLMPKELFALSEFSEEPYTLQTFNKGYYEKEISVSKLLKNNNEDFLRKAKEVGSFEFQYVFMKLSGGEGSYYYKPVNQRRKIWMEEHGGIKIYRDNFVVRPYGDPKSKSFDWLGLDARKGANPVAISHKSQQWHVNNSQIQGTVLISRTHNNSILDKASREGIIENEHFEILSNILKEIIGLFEKDRAYIAYSIKKYRDEKEANNKTKEQASEIAKEILKKKRKGKKNEQSQEDSNTEQLAKAVKIYEEEREEFVSEIKLLRALATNGLITTTMVHDLKTINSLLITRVDTLDAAIRRDNSVIVNRSLQDLRKNDEFLKAWITVVTTQSNKDRRKRLKKDIVKTIDSAIKLLSPILIQKKVELDFQPNGCSAVRRIFETDFDSIIYNLIINSIESFEETKAESRKITISLDCDDSKLYIHYSDNGHGLNESFLSNPYEIFEYGTTSKVDVKGNKTGTGLGMYIVASSVNEYNGAYTITKVKDEFGLDIAIPI